jgi:predicted aspartyl protease
MAIQGTVTVAREPVIVLETFPKKRKISVIIDTGFSGELCLHPGTIHGMGFERFGREPFVLADGRIVRADVYKGQIQWFNHRRSVEVIALDNPQGLWELSFFKGAGWLFISEVEKYTSIKSDNKEYDLSCSQAGNAWTRCCRSFSW